VRTTIFLAKNTAYASIDDIFLLKILFIPKICSKFAPEFGEKAVVGLTP